MSLFREKMTVGLAVNAQTFMPGETVVAHVRVAGGDAKARAIRIELGYSNTYWCSKSRSSSEGGGWENGLSTERITVASEELGIGDDGSAEGESTCDLDLELPTGSPASVERWVQWAVSAIVDRRRAFDRTETAPITVLAPRPAGAESGRSGYSSDATSEMVLEMPVFVARVGETLTGTLHVNPRDPYTARTVRVELQSEMRHEDNIVKQLAVEKVMLAGSTDFRAATPQQFRFQVTVPADGLPSLRARHNEVRWQLKGVCDRRMRSDACVAADIVVYNA